MGYYQGDDYYSDYSGPQIDNLLGKTVWQSNPNLLDNWYFVGGGSQQGGGQFPINQQNGKIITDVNSVAYSDENCTVVAGTVGFVLTAYPMTNGNYYYINPQGSSSPGAKYYVKSQSVVSGYIHAGSHGIDRWKAVYNITVEIKNDCLNIISTDWGIKQSFEHALPNETYTCSILARRYQPKQEGGGINFGFDHWLSSDEKAQISGEEWGLVSYTTKVPASSFQILTNGNYGFYSLEVKAMKLELGDTQTLAHQENGVWVLNEIPNYQEQLARCQRYQPIMDISVTEKMLPAQFVAYSETIAFGTFPTPVSPRSNGVANYENLYLYDGERVLVSNVVYAVPTSSGYYCRLDTEGGLIAGKTYGIFIGSGNGGKLFITSNL